ncbi:hypothetical protein BgiBS90_019744 [Biomphalaria glabrata]|nr:hypothetical protein BgiBS90_019744 [Biomphalaria glabrata]
MADASILIPIKQNSTYNKMLPSEAQENLVQRIILQLSVATVPAPWTSIGKAINRLIESSRKDLFYVNRNIVLNSSKQSLAAVKPRSWAINTIEKVVDFPEDVSSELKQLSFVSQFVNSSWILFPALQMYNTQQETGQGLMPQMKSPLTNTDSGFQTLPEVSKTSAYSHSHLFVMNNPESKKFITKGNKLKMDNKTSNLELVDGKKSSLPASGNSLKSLVARNFRSIKDNKKTDKTRGGRHLDHDLDVDNSRQREPRINQDKKWGSLGAGKFRRWWFGKVST